MRLETDPGSAGRVPDAEWSALAGDGRGECRVGLLRGQLAFNAGRVAAAEQEWAGAAERAEAAGLRRELFELAGWRAMAARARADAGRRGDRGDRGAARARARRARSRPPRRSTRSPTCTPCAAISPTAEALLAEAGAILEELGGLGAGVSHLEAFVRLLAGQPERAEALLREDAEVLSAMHADSALATTTALLARAVLDQGRDAEAAELASEAGRRAAPQDTLTQALWRGARARALSLGGREEEAMALAQEAVAVLEPTDLLSAPRRCDARPCRRAHGLRTKRGRGAGGPGRRRPLRAQGQRRGGGAGAAVPPNRQGGT